MPLRQKGPDSQIVDVAVRKLVPFILLFGLYLVSHGHLSPGGGFQGGVVLASAALVLALSRGAEATRRVFGLRLVTVVELTAFFLFLTLGAMGLAAGVHFLGNFLPLGRAGEVPSAGMVFFLNLVIGLEVGSGVTLILLALLEESIP